MEPSPATRCTISAGSTPGRAPSCRAISLPPTAVRALSTCRPTMARTTSCCAVPTDSRRSSRSWPTGVIATTGNGSARTMSMPTARNAAAASSTSRSIRPKARSAAICAKRAHCCPRATITSIPTRIRGARKPRSSIAARRSGLCRWTKNWAAAARCAAAPCPRSSASDSSPKRAAAGSARWSRGAPTGSSRDSAPGACRSRCS